MCTSVYTYGMSKMVLCLIFIIIPLLLLVKFSRTNKGIGISFLTGMLVFFLSQVCLRLPLLSFLNTKLSFSMFIVENPVLYGLLLAFSAGVFEESGRWIGFLALRKRHTNIQDAFFFGLGHGIMEVIIVVLLPVFVQGIEESVLVWVIVERFVAIAFHDAQSIFIWNGVTKQKAYILLFAIVLHGVFNMVAIFPLSLIWVEFILILEVVVYWSILYRTILVKNIRRVKK